MDCDRVIAALHRGDPVPERTLRQLCRRFTEVLAQEGNVVAIEGAVNIVGDVHGQFYDVLKLFSLGRDGVTQAGSCPTRGTCSWGTTWTAGTSRWRR